MRSRISLILILPVMITLAACNSRLPSDQELTQHFIAHRVEFEKLKDLLIEDRPRFEMAYRASGRATRQVESTLNDCDERAAGPARTADYILLRRGLRLIDFGSTMMYFSKRRAVQLVSYRSTGLFQGSSQARSYLWDINLRARL